MQVSIVPMTSEEEAKGKACVHCAAWKEAYRGLLSQGFLDARTLEFSEERALGAFRAGVGAGLMNAALQGMADFGKAVVWVLEGNERAIRFYEGFGFRFDGASQVLDLGGEVTDLRMVLQRN